MPSEKVLEQKKQVVKALTERMNSACSGVLVEYKGINVENDTKLRRELRENGVKYTVIKNTLLSRAAKEANLEMDSVLTGTTALATSEDDYVAPARILCKFADDNKFFNVKIGFIDGEVLDKNKVKEIAKLPSKEVLVAQALSGLNAPISGLATVLNGTIKGLVVALNAIAQKKDA